MLSPIKPHKYSKKERQLLNDVLEDLLSIYGHPVSVIKHRLQIDVDHVELFQNAPGIVEVMEAAGHYLKGTLPKQQAIWFANLIDDMLATLVRANTGNEFARKQMEVVEKILDPQRYGGIPVTVLEELITKHHTRPALARAWAIRSLMGKLSWGVESTKSPPNVLEGKIKLTDSEFLKKETTYWHQYGAWRSAYDVALEHWPKRGAPSLKSLAIKVYLAQLRKEGFTTISEATLESDLQELAEWDKAHAKENEHATQLLIFNADGPNQHLPWHPYSEGWKRSAHYEQNKEAVKRLKEKEGKSREIKKGGKKT